MADGAANLQCIQAIAVKELPGADTDCPFALPCGVIGESSNAARTYVMVVVPKSAVWPGTPPEFAGHGLVLSPGEYIQCAVAGGSSEEAGL